MAAFTYTAPTVGGSENTWGATLNQNWADLSTFLGPLDSAELATLDGVDTSGTGFGFVPQGGIIMWSGSVASIPSGWHLCDGTNGTPNLQDRFVVGVGTASTYAVNDTGGAASVTLTTGQLPAHTHSDGTLAAASAGVHRHYVLNQDNQGSFGGWVNNFLAKRNSTGGSENYNLNGTNTEPSVGLTSEAGDHTHDITGSTGSAGSGGAVATLPPYYALAYIMKA